MAVGPREILFFFMGIIAICLVASFSAYELTTYDSMRGILGSLVTDTSQGASLHSQYNNMVAQFSNNHGNPFTYNCGDQPVVMAPLEVAGKSEDQVIGMVLDKFAANLYNGNYQGKLSVLSAFAGAGAHSLYFFATLLLFCAFTAIFVLALTQQWYESMSGMLKSSGKMALVLGIIAFVAFLFLPSVANSALWSYNSSDLGRDLTYVVEPRIMGTLLVNMLILILFGALLYGAGFLVHINTGEGEPNPMEYVRSSPKMRAAGGKPQTRSSPATKVPASKPGRRQL